MNENTLDTKRVVLLMLLAYAFSFAIRLIWLFQFQGESSFMWNNQFMINTNDGYFFASGVQNELFGMHSDNPRLASFWSYGIISITTVLVKFTPLSLETVTLYLSAFISSLVVIPIILISRLYKETLWGFFAALLGAIAWSYYNRTMIGYYDTDMFAAMAPMFILYFLIKSTIEFNLRTALFASLAIIVYPLLYDQGQSLIYAMTIIYGLYMVYYHRISHTTYLSLILLFLALIPLPISKELSYIVHTFLVIVVYFILKQSKIETQKLMLGAGILFLLFLIFGNVFGLVFTKIIGYTSIGTGTDSEGLHFFQVVQTVREAGQIPFETFANRISGSIYGLIVAILGYILLVMRHRAFILALPLIGVGFFALFGGLRFTVYAVPIAALSAVYFIHFITLKISDKKSIYILSMVLLTAGLLYPNITHIIDYKVPTVFNKAEVKDLAALNKQASSKDYTLAWWDYGYPIWYYSDTNTLIDGGKHNNDNYIISKIMFSTSPDQVANLSRLAVETYVNSKYKVVADTIFKDTNPNDLMSELEDPLYKLPQKRRDIYLYMPLKMINIFPTVGIFANLDLTTGKKKRNILFYTGRVVKQKEEILLLSNGIKIDLTHANVLLGKQTVPIISFDVVTLNKEFNAVVNHQALRMDGGLNVVYLKSYNQLIVMDPETYNSAYVQMFMLGNYDKSLFDLVVSSPYTKIYKIKK